MQTVCCSSCMAARTPALPVRRNLAFAAPRPAVQQPNRASAQCKALYPQIISSAVLLVGAWYLSQQEAVAEQDHFEASDRRPCPTCAGSGVQPCMCTKWSDGDVGCDSCSHSGWTKCRSCGGGGTAVPIKVSIRRTDL